MCIKTDNYSCFACGACCVAFSISSLNKSSGLPCKYLDDNGLCSIYNKRPGVCRDFIPDELCVLISSLEFNKKVEILRKVYGM